MVLLFQNTIIKINALSPHLLNVIGLVCEVLGVFFVSIYVLVGGVHSLFGKKGVAKYLSKLNWWMMQRMKTDYSLEVLQSLLAKIGFGLIVSGLILQIGANLTYLV